MAQLFLDNDLLYEVTSNILFEGQKYYVNTENYSQGIIKLWIEENYLQPSLVSYHPLNKIVVIRFDNVVGKVNIFGTIYDVRSKKLYDNMEGNTQFQTLLDDINNLSKKLTFNFTGTSFAHRKTDGGYSQNDLALFDYYYQLAFLFPNSINLEALLNQCFKSPNAKNDTSLCHRGIEKSKKISSIFYTKLGTASNYANLKAEHPLSKSLIVRRIHDKTGKRLLPLNIQNEEFVSSNDTVENRFIRFFLEEISSVCLRLIILNLDSIITQKAQRLQKCVHHFLRSPFFIGITRLKFIPSASSVLLKKPGYSEIYYHFVQSKFTFKPILANLEKLRHTVGLKNIATLYELWAFFKVAFTIFGSELIEEVFHGQVQKNGSMVGSYTWKNENFELFYNRSFTKNNNGSYSITLRPDISIRSGKLLYIFDAKYKFNSANFDDTEVDRLPKPEDIHKMHAYLDAISNAKFAIVLYPGTVTKFYNKFDNENNQSLSTFEGIGAIPLSPLVNKNFENLLQTLKTKSD